jgi:hypothetical protein
MRSPFFRQNWCTAWFFVVREVTAARQSGKASAIGFMLRLDTLLFYRMVQGHFRQMRFGVTSSCLCKKAEGVVLPVFVENRREFFQSSSRW